MRRKAGWLTAGLAALAMATLCGCDDTDGGGDGGGTATVIGNWRVIKFIIGGSQTAPIDWNTGQPAFDAVWSGMQDGDAIFEDWSITEENGQLKLTGNGASAYGVPTAYGAYFEAEGVDPVAAAYGVQGTIRVTVTCNTSANGELWGGQVFQRFTGNGLGMFLPSPPESWVFRATRR